MTVNEKIAALRELMQEKDIYAYYIGTADPHNSEYIAPYFRARAFMSGFNGSAGTMIVTLDKALLWVDGRYHIQAEKDVADSEIILMKQGVAGVPKTRDWLFDNLPKGSRLAISGDLYSDSALGLLALKLGTKDISLVTDLDLIDEIWTERPALPQGEVKIHPLEYTGESTKEKLTRIRAEMKKNAAEAAFYVGLDDIMWIMNLIGQDVPGNPVALSFALIEQDKATLFIDLKKINSDVADELKKQGVDIAPYDEVKEALAQVNAKTIALDRRRVSRNLVQSLDKDVKVIQQLDYPQMMKAKLNAVEQKSQLKAGIRDSLYVTSYLYFVKHKAVDLGLNEYSVSHELERLRREDPLYIGPSFDTISAYGPNAAMMHYQATAEDHEQLKAKGLYLVDCGAQMWDGTTDITRTVAIGKLTREEKEAYTLTLRSHIALASLPFLKGSSGVALDTVARSVVWRQHQDYKCGTGHGVGFVSGVHEGPQRLTASVNAGKISFEPGMVTTIEPGIYLEGKLGIRLENDYFVVEDEHPLNSQNDIFYVFKPYTFVPFDREAILVEQMTDSEICWLNDYHNKVRMALLEIVEDKEVEKFILEQTKPFPLSK